MRLPLFLRRLILPIYLLAMAAAARASEPFAVIITLSANPATTLSSGASTNLQAVVTGDPNTAVTWDLSPNVGFFGGSVGPSAGGVTTNVYTAPPGITANQTVTITATSVADPTRSASKVITLIPVSVALNPTAVTLIVNQTQQFAPTVAGATDPSLIWTLDQPIGTISSAGLYTAPSTLPGTQPITVTVTATSVADPTKFANATITLSPITVTLAANPTSVAASATSTLTAGVIGNASGSAAVTWDYNPKVGTLAIGGAPNKTGQSTNTYTAPNIIPVKQVITVTATSVADPNQVATTNITLNATPVTVVVTPSPVTLTAGMTQQFSAAVTGTSNAAVTWSINPPTAGAIDPNGLYTAPAAVSANQTVTVIATSVFQPTTSGTATVTLQAVGITVSPSTASLSSSQTQQFTATVVGSANTAVTWSLNPPTGSIDPTGFYTAPSGIATIQKVTVTATSQADPSKSASASLTLSPGVIVTLSSNPAAVSANGTSTLTANVVGSNNAAVTWSYNPQVGALGVGTTPTAAGTSTNTYTAPASIPIKQTVVVSATSVADPTQTASTTITLNAVAVSIVVTPSPVTLAAGMTQQFSAAVSGTSITGVTWSISPAAAGSIDQNGFYTAPATVSANQTVTVTATSVFAPGSTGSATVTLQAVNVAVAPATATLTSGQTAQFSATVNGASNPAVTWTISPVTAGAIDSNGLYTAPTGISASQKVTVTATSIADPSKSANATVTLQPITITVTPSTVTLAASQSQQYTATFNGAPQQPVLWSINPPLIGAIDPSGVYRAPSTFSGNQTITVTATAVSDPTITGTATINLRAVGVTVTPATVTLSQNQTQEFTATVTNSTNSAVTWSLNPPTGTIDVNGIYTAPATIAATTRVVVTATSQADPTKSGTATITLNLAIDVGTGAPTQLMTSQFQQAFYRNGFNTLVALPPLAAVQRLGTTGYMQRFADAARTTGVTYALDTVSPTAPLLADGTAAPPVVQIYPTLYAYYTVVGSATAGYPINDSQVCPPLASGNTCTYGLFDKPYALFAYDNALATGSNFAVRAGFYTEWVTLGGINALGPPVDVETAITAFTATTATEQLFDQGAIYTITSGANRNKVFGVMEPLYDLYITNKGPAGTLGLPTADEFILSSGVHRQTFEGGSLEYTPGGTPVVRPPVASVVITGAPAASVTLNLGDTLSLTATAYSSNGAVLPNRPVSWTTTNGSVLSIQANGATAVVKAVAGGAAAISAASEGVVSSKINIVVVSPCCQVGEGAPVTVQQSFQAALVRDQISVQVPVNSPASRVGAGYVQMVVSTSTASPTVYMLAQADTLGTAHLVSDAILAYYQNAGGPAGSLGYPIADVTSGGTQLFQNAALGGNPVRLVTTPILAKWALLGYESGAAGAPTAEAVAFSTFDASSGPSQTFTGGTIYGSTAGSQSGKAFFVKGLILASYLSLGGAAGDFGMPVTDEFVTGTLHQQNFEGGNITYSDGDSAAQSHLAPKVPNLVVAPATITAGGRARLAIVGFNNNASIRVSVTGQSDFIVAAPNGSYTWDMFIPLNAQSGAVTVRAVDIQSSASASGTLTVRGFGDNRLTVTKLQGDNQTGAPGTLLPLALRISLVDTSGSPVAGAPIVFQASSGIQLSTGTAITDSSGRAETLARLPNSPGVALVTADSPGIARAPVTFGLIAAASSLNNFPAAQQSGATLIGGSTSTIAQKGALLTAVASVLRYRQNRGELPAPNGLADAATLNQFLKSFCAVDAHGVSVCDGYLSNPDSGEPVVNLWRAAAFTGGADPVIDTATPGAIADRVAQGAPVILSLALSLNGTLVGGHFVVATGVAADGSVLIQDPNPFFSRPGLNDYLIGFTGAGGIWKATLRGAMEFALQTPSATRFMLGAISQPDSLMQNLALSIHSAVGTCGEALDLLDSVDSSGHAAAPLTSRIQVCDGSQPAYQLNIGTSQKFRAFVTDLASGGSVSDVSGTAPAAYQATRPQLPLVLSPQAAAINIVVDAATFTRAASPGGIISIFGAGLSGAAATTTVDFDGISAKVLFVSAFQINAQVPPALAPGTHTLHVQSAFGTATASVNVAVAAPGIFLVGNPPAGAVTNQDGSLNSAANPAVRGQALIIYCTGLGATTVKGQYSVTNGTLTALIGGTELPVAYAGLTPGYIGLYQVNVIIPVGMPPGLGISLTLKEGGSQSNTVLVAFQ